MNSTGPLQPIDEDILSILVCPVTRSKLRLVEGFLVSEVGGLKYPIRNGIPDLLPEDAILPAGVTSLDEFREKFAGR